MERGACEGEWRGGTVGRELGGVTGAGRGEGEGFRRAGEENK